MENEKDLSDTFLLEELAKRLKEKNGLLKGQMNLLVELEQLNDRLIESERVKSGFLSNIRNEINNPLTAILGLSGELFHGKDLSETKIKHISGIINKEALSLDFQLRNIFSAAEIESGETNPQSSNVNIDNLIQTQISFFKFKSFKKNITVVYNPLNGILFKTDGAMLQSIVMNLLANAIEFSIENQKVAIDVEIADGKLKLRVQNQGEGISSKDQKYIFDRFKQLDTGTTKNHQGHGLGLSIVKEFTDLLGGKIVIDSELDKQTTITVLIPEFSFNQLPESFSSDGQEILFGDEEIL